MTLHWRGIRLALGLLLVWTCFPGHASASLCGLGGSDDALPGTDITGYWQGTLGILRIVRTAPGREEGPAAGSEYLRGTFSGNTWQGQAAIDTGTKYLGTFNIQMTHEGRCLKGTIDWGDGTDEVLGQRIRKPSDPYTSYYVIDANTETLKQMVGGTLDLSHIDGPDDQSGPGAPVTPPPNPPVVNPPAPPETSGDSDDSDDDTAQDNESDTQADQADESPDEDTPQPAHVPPAIQRQLDACAVAPPGNDGLRISMNKTVFSPMESIQLTTYGPKAPSDRMAAMPDFQYSAILFNSSVPHIEAYFDPLQGHLIPMYGTTNVVLNPPFGTPAYGIQERFSPMRPGKHEIRFLKFNPRTPYGTMKEIGYLPITISDLGAPAPAPRKGETSGPKCMTLQHGGPTLPPPPPNQPPARSTQNYGREALGIVKLNREEFAHGDMMQINIDGRQIQQPIREGIQIELWRRNSLFKVLASGISTVRPYQQFYQWPMDFEEGSYDVVAKSWLHDHTFLTGELIRTPVVLEKRTTYLGHYTIQFPNHFQGGYSTTHGLDFRSRNGRLAIPDEPISLQITHDTNESGLERAAIFLVPSKVATDTIPYRLSKRFSYEWHYIPTQDGTVSFRTPQNPRDFVFAVYIHPDQDKSDFIFSESPMP